MAITPRFLGASRKVVGLDSLRQPFGLPIPSESNVISLRNVIVLRRMNYRCSGGVHAATALHLAA